LTFRVGKTTTLTMLAGLNGLRAAKFLGGKPVTGCRRERNIGMVSRTTHCFRT
jgi:ABC-type sugar transport system ATPase subunit